MRGIIVNSGNANCCTRVDGYPASIATAQKLAAELDGVDPVADSRLLHRRDRRASARRQDPRRGAAARAHARLAGRHIQGIRARHHDHRHAPEMGGGKNPHRRETSPASRLREGFGDDRAAHGHHARLHCHRRSDFASLAFARTQSGGRAHVQFDHRRWRYLDKRHGGSPRQRRVRRAKDRKRRQLRFQLIFPPRSKASASRSRSRSSKMAKARSA